MLSPFERVWLVGGIQWLHFLYARSSFVLCVSTMTAMCVSGAKGRSRPWTMRKSPSSRSSSSLTRIGSGIASDGEEGSPSVPALGASGNRGSLRKSLKFLPELLGGLSTSSKLSRRGSQRQMSCNVVSGYMFERKRCAIQHWCISYQMKILPTAILSSKNRMPCTSHDCHPVSTIDLPNHYHASP